MTLPPEQFITHITSIWIFPTMYQTMCLQTTPLYIGFITYITGKWPLPSRYVVKFIQTALLEWKRKYISIPLDTKKSNAYESKL
jgi:hypothetical protein